jgi:hypothetical protein
VTEGKVDSSLIQASWRSPGVGGLSAQGERPTKQRYGQSSPALLSRKCAPSVWLVHTCNPSKSGGGGRNITNSRPVQAKLSIFYP